MGEARKISIALTEELAREIETAVASGDYATVSEVVRDALRIWKGDRGDRAAATRRLRQLWEEGLASGKPVAMPANWAADVIARGHARMAEKPKTG